MFYAFWILLSVLQEVIKPLYPRNQMTVIVNRINRHASSAFRLLPYALIEHCVWTIALWSDNHAI